MIALIVIAAVLLYLLIGFALAWAFSHSYRFDDAECLTFIWLGWPIVVPVIGIAGICMWLEDR